MCEYLSGLSLILQVGRGSKKSNGGQSVFSLFSSFVSDFVVSK